MVGSTITVPPASLVVLIGAAGSGKSTFAHRHFRPTEVVSSDRCRALVSDDENDQTATRAAFAVLHTIVAKRLEHGRVAVVDATNAFAHARRPLVDIAHRTGAPLTALVLDVPVATCVARNLHREERDVPDEAVFEQAAAIADALAHLTAEGFGAVHHLVGVAAVDAARIARL